MRLSPTTQRIMKYSSYVNSNEFSIATLDRYVAKLEEQEGRRSYGLNYTHLKSGLTRITLIFKDQEEDA